MKGKKKESVLLRRKGRYEGEGWKERILKWIELHMLAFNTKPTLLLYLLSNQRTIGEESNYNFFLSNFFLLKIKHGWSNQSVFLIQYTIFDGLIIWTFDLLIERICYNQLSYAYFGNKNTYVWISFVELTHNFTKYL